MLKTANPPTFASRSLDLLTPRKASETVLYLKSEQDLAKRKSECSCFECLQNSEDSDSPRRKLGEFFLMLRLCFPSFLSECDTRELN